MYKKLFIIWMTVCSVTPTSIFAQNPRNNPCENVQLGSFIADHTDCAKFYYCNQYGEGLSVFCPDGMWFNEKKGICDIPEHAECVLDPTIAPSPTPPIEDIDCPERDSKKVIFIASKLSCTRYYICYHGIPMEQECIPELHWNEQVNKCDYPENSNCKLKSELPPCPIHGQKLLPHPDDCDYFIYCINGFSTVQQCPFYHHWDVKTKTCKWRNHASCFGNLDKFSRNEILRNI